MKLVSTTASIFNTTLVDEESGAVVYKIGTKRAPNYTTFIQRLSAGAPFFRLVSPSPSTYTIKKGSPPPRLR